MIIFILGWGVFFPNEITEPTKLNIKNDAEIPGYVCRNKEIISVSLCNTER